jgi:PASTA domain
VCDDDHTPIQPSEPLAARGRGVAIEGYEGLRAGAAVAAVRRVGLRPSLERVEGYEAGIHGFVVGQDPSAGAEVQAGGQVVLFIAAPARTIIGGHPDRDGDASAGDYAPDASLDAETDVPTSADIERGSGESERDAARGAGGLPLVEGEIDFESLWVGEAGYEDETLQVHEIAAPAEWADEPTEEYESVERESHGLATGPERAAATMRLRRSWRSTPRSVRWGGASLFAVAALTILVGIADHSGAAPRRSALRARVFSSPTTGASGVTAATPPASTTAPAPPPQPASAHVSVKHRRSTTRQSAARPMHERPSVVREAPARSHAAAPAGEDASSAAPQVSAPARASVPLDARSPAQMSPEEHLEAEFGP